MNLLLTIPSLSKHQVRPQEEHPVASSPFVNVFHSCWCVSKHHHLPGVTVHSWSCTWRISNQLHRVRYDSYISNLHTCVFLTQRQTKAFVLYLQLFLMFKFFLQRQSGSGSPGGPLLPVWARCLQVLGSAPWLVWSMSSVSGERRSTSRQERRPLLCSTYGVCCIYCCISWHDKLLTMLRLGINYSTGPDPVQVAACILVWKFLCCIT